MQSQESIVLDAPIDKFHTRKIELSGFESKKIGSFMSKTAVQSPD